jgi:glycine/D-amino acid oxidase-like deaminating enzyme
MLEKCHGFGVEVVHPAKVVKASLDDEHMIQSVQYTCDDTTHEVACHHVVFAAGAWTPSLLDDLFPSSSLDLKPKTDGLSWMIFKNPDPSSQQDQITLMLAPLLDHGDFELAAREDGTIFVCGDPDSTEHLPEFTSTGVFEPVESSIDRFKSLLRRYVKPFAEGTAELQVVHQGLSYRPTNTLNRPIIAAVPSHELTPGVIGQKPTQKSGVYVCTGHGFYGITMSFGSGKVMSALVLGLEPEIDVTVLDLPA